MKETEGWITSTFGYELKVTTSEPSEGAAFAAVLMLHGFGTSRNNRLNKKLAPWLAERGIASVRFDFAGHGESGGNTRDLTIGTAAADVATVYRSVQNLTGTTALNCAAVAASFGASALLRSVKRLEHLRAMVLRAPVSNYAEVRRLQFGDSGIADWKKTGLLIVDSSRGSIESGYDFYLDAKAHDTYAAAKNLSTPTLVIQGSEDETVPLNHSELLVSAIGPKAHLEIISGADHSFKNEDQFNLLFDLAGGFLLQHLRENQ
jgi:alpha-beta hydrolase superfamily lysophospholipase